LLDYEVAILGGETEDLKMCMAAIGEVTRRESWGQQGGSRRYLVVLLEMLAIVCKFRHNRRFLRSSVGGNFARLLVSLLLALCRYGDKLGVEWSHAEGVAAHSLVDKTRFTVACLYQTVLVIHYCIPSYPLYCFLVEERSVLPKHPWTAANLALYCGGQHPDGSGRGE